MSRSCPYVPGLDCGGEVLLVGRMSQSLRKGIVCFHAVLYRGHMQLTVFLLLTSFFDYPNISPLKMELVSGQGISLLYSIF